uniref:Girdin n=1 Tax=Oreochromis niloticus TaxID=8128 RepID=A0A669ERN5_ORENI
MESGVFLPCLDQFMLSPLVTWVRTFVPNDGGMHLDFSELLDGVFLNDIMTQINPSAASQGAKKMSKDPSQRIQNLNFLVQQIKTFYLDNLRQLIMTPLPNVLLLGRTPYCEQSLDEMKKLLLLLLGCAVQCEKKEEYIERIQTLDFETKAAIAAHIQEFTHSQENVLDLQWLESSELHPDEMEAVVRNMTTHLQHLLDQRDAHLETIAELMQEKEGVVSVLSSPSSPQSASYSPTIQQQQVGTQQHLAVELADSKAKIRRLRQELEEKSEQMLDCRHELENMEAELKRIQQENSQLLLDARTARTYRDELDALRERAIKADKLESEVGRYREQLHKMEFYKAKVEELKEDNRVLQETKEVLEDQLEGWRARSDKIHQLEKHNLLLKAQVHDMEQEREADRRRVEELQTDNLALCLAQRRSMEESQHLGWELEQLSKTTESSQGQQTLSEEVSERACSRLLKLEKENKHLLKTIEELRASVNNITQTKHSYLAMCSNNCTSSTDESSVLQTSCSNAKNHSNGVSLSIVTESMLNGDLSCHQQLDTEELERVQSVNHLPDNPERNIQEKGQLEDGDSGDHFKERMSDLEVLENNHNRRHCFVRSHDHSPGSKNSSPRHESIFTGLPTRSSYASKHTQRLEAKCRALDTVNQHLQTSLDNTDRKVQRLEAEVEELEAENQSLQASLEELRISARRLEQLETEKQTLERETTALERDKRQLEKENRRLRQQAEIQEAKLDSSNVCMASLEREMRFLVKEVEGLRETAERVKGLERDNRELTKQAAIDQRTLATLREELVSEKLRTQQRDNELERLSHELEMKVLNQESAHQAELERPDNSRFKMLESELETSLKRSLQIKDDKLASLEARLQESSSLNQQLRQELKSVKLSYEALQQRQEEERTTSSSTPPRETGKAMSEWLRESQEATKELLKLKDRLIEVERNVEKSTLNSQSASLMAQNTQLQQQQSKAESERDSAIHEREELRGAQEQLLRDHERLAVLHERQAMEYEALMGKHGCLKNAHRTLELEHRTLQDRYNSLLQQRSKLEDLEKALKEEQMRMALEKEQHRTTAAECCRLRDEKDWLNQTYRQLLNDNEALTSDHKQLKSQLNEAKLEHTWLEADFSKLKKDYQQLDITCTKLTNQCELLSQLKGNLEEENRHLLAQIETLMLQNRTLLEQTMESKDLFHVEERQYIDKLNHLRRQKEKLEEKIMDQYKFYEPSPPRRRGNWITLKLKKLMKSNSREHGPERPPTPTHSGVPEPQLSCHDNSSFISSDGSGGSASTSACDVISPQRNSTTLKMFPRMRNRLKDRDKVKSLFWRSIYNHSNDSNLPSGLEDNDELQNHGLNCAESRAQSESSVEFSLSLENEPWSNGSSPVQHPPSRRSSSSSYQPPSDASTPQHTKQQHKEKASTMPTANSKILDIQCEPKQRDPVLPQDFWLRRGTKSIRRGSRGKMTRRASDSGGTGKINPGLNGMNPKLSTSKAETTKASACSPITVLYVQGKSSSMSGCLNCFSSPMGKEGRLKGPWSPKSLPRASSVISTAEGSSRRSSVSSDYKVIVKTDLLPVQVSEYSESNIKEEAASPNQQPEPEIKSSEPAPIPPVKPPRDPAAVQEPLFDSSFTFKSVFSNTIFGDSVATTTTSLDGLDTNQTVLCQNSPLDQICSREVSKSVENTPQTVLNMADEQNSEHAAGLEGKDEQLTIA